MASDLENAIALIEVRNGCLDDEYGEFSQESQRHRTRYDDGETINAIGVVVLEILKNQKRA